MASMWYYSSKNQQKGPITWDELRGLAREGQLRNSDMVWQEGTPDWVRAGQVDGLFGGAAARSAVATDEPGPRRRAARDDYDDEDRRPRRSVRREPQSSSKGLVIGLIAGGGALLVIAIVVVIIIAVGGSNRNQKKPPFPAPPVVGPPIRPPVGPPPFAGGREILRVNDTLNNLDPRDRLWNGFSKTFQVKMVAGKTYMIDHMGPGFDAYLRLENAAGMQVAVDDDGGDGLDSRIVYTAPASESYRIICTTLGPGQTGPFTLIVREN